MYCHFLFHLTLNSVTTDRVAHPVSYEEAKFTADLTKEIPKQCIVFQLGS